MTLLRQPANWWRENRLALLASITAMFILLFTIGGAVGIANAATKPAAADDGVKGQTFTIATDTTWAPFEFQRDGELRGIDIDLIHAVAEDQGFDVKIDVLGFDGALAAVTAGQADAVMAGMSITKERQKTFDFSNPYFDSGIQMAIASDDTSITGYEDLEESPSRPRPALRATPSPRTSARSSASRSPASRTPPTRTTT
ncbi:transporter substrate-binding domain-containing protein [Microbacterium suwonense]|uniref:Solute-binding protein family 3/N-terminal domain-containing protein n=1 Tax=Microbacterium suwonense TaxID=683047 RepID=A0ABN6X4S0_9MICO|nr:hypothetical protein GCM10025863_21810 [Microbacterium suwonense]